MTQDAHSSLRFQVDEKPPWFLSAATGAQIVVLILTGILVTPSIVARGAHLDPGQASWLIFAALMASGAATLLQVQRLGYIGGGTVLFVGSNVAFVSVCIAAIEGGGLPLLGTLVAVSALATALFTFRLGALRRILTPAVGGTVLVLMVFSVAPTVWRLLGSAPEQFKSGPVLPATALVTLLPIIVISLFGSVRARLWAPLVGVLAGSLFAASQGLVDTSVMQAAPWIGLPAASWPGLDLNFGDAFWTLLPAFVLITLVGCIETYADSIAAQRMSWRHPRPIDFRAVQGSINADGAGSFLAGLLGTVPNTVYSTSVGVVELTGVAARAVALWGGSLMVLLAFSPKIAALVTSMPNVVAGSYILVLMAIILGHGIRLITEEPLDFPSMMAVTLGIWAGTGFQGGHLFNLMFPESMQAFLSNGTTVGGLTTMILMGALSLRGARADRRTLILRRAALLDLRDMVEQFCTRAGWDERARDKLMLAAEEGFLILLESSAQKQAESMSPRSRLQVRLALRDHEAEVEFVSAPVDSNLETALASLDLNAAPAPDGSQASLRLLRALTTEVRHLQYQGVDYLLMRVDTQA